MIKHKKWLYPKFAHEARDRWRTAGPPGPKMRKAMAGDFIGLDPAEMRCEDVIAKTINR